MDHSFIFETAHDMNNRVGFANRVQELIAHTFALRRSAYESGNINEFNACRDQHFRLDDPGQRCQPFVGDGDNAYVGFAGGKCVVGD
jgi:hypothetical protein